MKEIYTNDFIGKKKLVESLSEVYKNIQYSDIESIELKMYRNKNKPSLEEEFVLLTWVNGGKSTANNNANSFSATARNVARMLDGGVYENYDFYMEIMGNDNWEEIE